VDHVVRETELGRVAVSTDALRHMVVHALAESYGIVGRAGRRGPFRLVGRGTRGVSVKALDSGLAIDIHVVVEYGLNLAEVTATARERVQYEVERMTGLAVASLEIHVDEARRSG
jgi:uncharacterized alkaline shock family protein YloU